MYLTYFTHYALGALGASAIVIVLGAAFEYGHAVTLAGLLQPLLVA